MDKNRDGLDNIDDMDEMDDIGLLDSDDFYSDEKVDFDSIDNSLEDIEDDLIAFGLDEEEENSEEDDETYILNDYGTNEIEETELIIDDMGEFEKDDYWVDDEEGYEGLDIDELS